MRSPPRSPRSARAAWERSTRRATEWGRLSPDGRWLAYISDESGRAEVYVRPVPAMAPKIPISRGGTRSLWPVWSRSGHELYYWDAERRLTAVRVETEPAFDPGVPEVLFSGPFDDYFDVTPSGDFVMVQIGDSHNELVLVENFDQELRRFAPSD